MGMNHFGEIALLTRIAQPDIAVITNIGTMHMENLGSREGILQAKLEILEGLRPGGLAVFNGDNDLLSSVAEQYHAVTFGLGGNNDVRAVNITTENDTTHFTAVAFGTSLEITLPAVGEHNILNALAAIAVGLKCGVAPERIEGGLADFRNTGMRQHIYDCSGVKIIEDCYNAGPESMEAALNVLGNRTGRRIAVLGEMLELGRCALAEHYRVGRIAAEKAEEARVEAERKAEAERPKANREAIKFVLMMAVAMPSFWILFRLMIACMWAYSYAVRGF